MIRRYTTSQHLEVDTDTRRAWLVTTTVARNGHGDIELARAEVTATLRDDPNEPKGLKKGQTRNEKSAGLFEESELDKAVTASLAGVPDGQVVEST